MKEQFATYEIALKLKELGFNEECICFYNDLGILFYQSLPARYDGYRVIEQIDFKIFEEDITAPLWQQVIDWFRDIHGIKLTIDTDITLSWIYSIQSLHPEATYVGNYITSTRVYSTYEEAREQAILKSIELIKKRQNGMLE